MDEIVRAAMRKWPNVPHCYGWLNVDMAGRWRVGAWPGEVIHHAGLNAFIGRNYLRFDDGSYIFQNGPQRVYVRLEYTPYVYRLADATGQRFVAHTGQAVERVDAWFTDEHGHVLLLTPLGIGVLDGRDLSAWTVACEALGDMPELELIESSTVAKRFGFIPSPSQVEGTKLTTSLESRA
ncbi:MAG: hypothetical protein RL341_1285 [Pseudomonadota bacterium]|jgi:hypothetical protein